VRSLDGEAYLLAHLSPLLGIEALGDNSKLLKTQLGELADALYASRKDLGSAGLALAARGMQAIDRTSQAKEMVTLLLSRGVKDSHGLHWAADTDRPSAWFGEDLDATGGALAAIAAVTPQDARAAEIVRWLAARRTGMAWRSTRETAPVAEGLAEYATARPAGVAAGQRLSVAWNGEDVLQRTLDASDAFASQPIRIVIPGAKLKPGDNRLTLSRSGAAAGGTFFSWEARALVPSPGPEAPKDAPLRVTREYLRAERTADRRGRPRYVATPLDPGATLRVGEQVLVRLTLTASRAIDYVLVEDPRVAGFEIDALLPEGVDRPYGTNGEERDTHAAFFVDRLDSGDTVIEYLVRPELAGTFTALPTEAVGMYEPELLTRGNEAKVTVEGRK
jgi:uncharacterized protein YfaS (alpha-2-macroglobulin family)